MVHKYFQVDISAICKQGDIADMLGTRHSTYGDRDRSGHHSSVSRTPSHSSQKSIEGDVVVVREPRIERRDSLRQERGGGSPRERGDCGIPPGSPGGNSSGSNSASPSVHHRANSGPTIAISMFHDPDSNSGVCMPRRSPIHSSPTQKNDQRKSRSI